MSINVEIKWRDPHGSVQSVMREVQETSGRDWWDAGVLAILKVAHEARLAGARSAAAKAKSLDPNGLIVVADVVMADSNLSVKASGDYELTEPDTDFAAPSPPGPPPVIGTCEVQPEHLKRACEALQHFVERIQDMESTEFYRRISKDGVKISIQFAKDGSGKTEDVSFDGPSLENLKAFLLDLRFLVQPRDGINLEKIAQLFESLPVSDRLKMSFVNHSKGIEKFLASSNKGMKIDGEEISSRRLLEVVLYGRFAHTKSHGETYRKWAEEYGLEIHLRSDFMIIVSHLLRLSSYLAKIAKVALRVVPPLIH